jgi:hypothetical protein
MLLYKINYVCPTNLWKPVSVTPSVLNLLSSLNFQSKTSSTLTINIFFLLYNTWWKIIPLKSTLKTQSIYIFCIKYYITHTKIFKVKVEDERLKKSIVDNKFETEGV